MLKLKDLKNRVYSGNICVGFEYTVKDNEGRNLFEAKFKKIQRIERQDKTNQWHLQIVLERTRDADSQVYGFGYIMPKEGLPLELIAATGLKYYQLYLKEEIQKKTNYDFALGEILKDM